MSEFDKAVKHVEKCLFWDFVDGQWLEELHTPFSKDFFNRLMQGVVEVHETENAELRELCADMMLCIMALRDKRPICWECPHHRDVDELRSACFLFADARELGVKVK